MPSGNSRPGWRPSERNSKKNFKEHCMENENQFTNKSFLAMMRRDCRAQAEAAEIKLGQVIDALTDENHLGALGSFVGLDEDMARLRVFLVDMARLTGAEKASHS